MQLAPVVGSRANNFKLSQLGIPDDADLSLVNPSYGVDHWGIIQEVLDKARPNNPVNLIWDRTVSVSDTLVIKGDTHIRALPGKGAILRDGVNKSLFKNKNVVFGENAAIIDKNISLRGGIWNGNAAGQTLKGTSADGAACVFAFYGVENFKHTGFSAFTPRTYALHGINIVNGLIDDFVVNVGNGAFNMDGVHFDGHSINCTISNGRITAHDDGIGLNAGDLYQSLAYFDGAVVGYYPAEAAGPISNIWIKTIEFLDSLYGIRGLSGSDRMDGIYLDNIFGTTKGYALILDNYQQDPNAVTHPGPGNIGTVNVNDFRVVVNDAGFGSSINQAVISLSADIEHLNITNLADSTVDGVPTIYKDPAHNITITRDGVPYP